LANTRYRFVLEDGSEIEVKGNEESSTMVRFTRRRICLTQSRRSITGNFKVSKPSTHVGILTIKSLKIDRIREVPIERTHE